MPWPFPGSCNRNTKNVYFAIKLRRMVMHVLSDVPPSVPPRSAPLVSVLSSRELKPRREACRLERLGVRRTRLYQFDVGSEEINEGYNWEPSEEESVA